MKNDTNKPVWKIRIIILIFYIISLGFTGFAYYFFQSHLILTVMIAGIFLPLITGMYAVNTVDRVSVTVYAVPDGDKSVDIEIIIKNDSLMPVLDCYLIGEMKNSFYDTGGQLQCRVAVPARDKEKMIVYADTDYSGVVGVNIFSIKYKDLMGMLWIEKEINLESNLVVFPDKRVISADEMSVYSAGVSEAEETLSRGNDFAEVTDVRQYIPGDRLKDIHWKLSAKTDELMVKQRSSVAQSRMILVADITAPREETEENLKLAYSLSRAFIRDKIPVRLMWWNVGANDFDEYTIISEGQIQDAFRELYYVTKPKQREDMGNLIEKIHPGLHAYCLIKYDGESKGEVVSHV